jgi:hypothetical protein
MIRIAQFSDLHYSEKNLVEADRCFGFAVDEAIRRSAEVAVISGDSTDHALDVHSPAVARLARQVRRLADHCPVLMLQGTYSHEPPGTLAIFRLLGGHHGVHVADRIGQVALHSAGTWCASEGWRFDAVPGDARVIFTCVPTVNKAMVAASVGAADAGVALGQELAALLAGYAAINQAARQALVPTVGVSHGTVTGCITEHGVPMAGFDHEFTSGVLFSTRAQAFMLGHIHRHQHWEQEGRRRIAICAIVCARMAAIEAVLRDNLFGLEIDPRCTQIAAFNLALAAWRRIGYRQLPSLHLACSGLSLGVSKAEWLKLAERAAQALPVPPKTDLLGTEDNLFSDAMKRGFERLYDLFARAPWLGSLIDPRAAGGDLIEHGFDDLEPLLAKVMGKAETAELAEMAVAAQGLAKAAQTLARGYTLVATNVPYLGRGKQDEVLKDYSERHHPEAKADLATCFVERCISLCNENGSIGFVSQYNWWFLASYRRLRAKLLCENSLWFAATLGEEAWQAFGDRGPVATLMIVAREPSAEQHEMAVVDALHVPKIEGKMDELRRGNVRLLAQEGQRKNPDHRITTTLAGAAQLLSEFARSFQGIASGDYSRFGRVFWEFAAKTREWEYQQSTVDAEVAFGGRRQVLRWECGSGDLARSSQARVQGLEALGKWGVAVSQMRYLPTTIYSGELFDNNCSAVVTDDRSTALALWAFCESGEYKKEVRRIDRKVGVTNATLVKVPFDRDYWVSEAKKRYPAGFPLPTSSDATQWLFNGHPRGSDTPLQVAVARLVGYQWPRQAGSSFADCPALGPDGLDKHTDRDGIVTLNPVKGEQPAAGRLLTLLADAFGGEWSAARLDSLLVQAGFAGKSLDDWLRDAFFEQHCELFHQRPFVWHVCDGRRDGFHALVNYHRLAAPNGEGRRTLEKLLYSYLGDWIDRQRADQKAGVEGADARVAAAEHLKTELTNILAGEPPYDLFVRWKPIAEQPIGWEPDINDGVRINIRPFMTAKPLGARAKGACVLRTTPKIKWDKDRGKEPQWPREDFPWFWNWNEQSSDFEGRGKEPDGNRWNDLHYTRAFKEAARARKAKG